MVWSPLSNPLLFGATANIKAAKAEGVRIGIGPDWSASGSKNLLGELKVAHLVSQAQGGVFTDREIVHMATRGAAEILQWDKVLGSLEAGRRADILVVAGTAGDPYASLIKAKETDIRLVMINGVARYGHMNLLKALGATGEQVKVGGQTRMVYLTQATQDPHVATVSLKEAQSLLKKSFQNIAKVAKRLESSFVRQRGGPAGVADAPKLEWFLALDELEETGVDLRHRLSYGPEGAVTGATRVVAAGPAPLSTILEPVKLDR